MRHEWPGSPPVRARARTGIVAFPHGIVVMLHVMELIAGGGIVLLVILDVFLTVLYARIGAGILSPQIARATWWVFSHLARWFGQKHDKILSLCGPSILVNMLVIWALLLTLGAGLIIHPALGTSVTVTSGQTPTDFISALYAGGSSMAIVRASDVTPDTGPYRLYFLFNSLLGASVISLTVTYLMQVYNALQRRNTLAYKLYLQTGETNDAAELLAGLGARDSFRSGYTSLADIAVEMTVSLEAHHFYPVLFYFRFPRPIYGVASFTLLAMDEVTLIKSALSDSELGWLKESVPVTQLWRSALLLVDTQEKRSRQVGAADEAAGPDATDVDRWKRRYHAAVRRLREAGIATTPDEAAGAANYVALRSQWQHQLMRAMQMMGYTAEEIDPIAQHPESSAEREPFVARRHGFGSSSAFDPQRR
jgi:muconolactone delta-isomerase